MTHRIVHTFRLALLAAALSVAGCGGGGADVESNVSGQTLGQELIDLQKAYQGGIISKSEYDDKRKQLLDRR